MNLSDVKVGDRLVTKKGGVVVVDVATPNRIITSEGFYGGVWNWDGSVSIGADLTALKYGPIVGREE